MKHTPLLAALLACGIFASTAALAETPAPSSPWSVRVGVLNANFDSAKTTYARVGADVDAAAFPGAVINVSNNTTLGFDIGYSVTPELTVRLGLGIPPTTKLTSSGTLSAAVPDGTLLAKVKYGPAMLTATYGLGQWGPVKPYLGGGVAYNIIFASRDEALYDVKVHNSFGGVLQAGFEVPLGDGWSVGLDVKKIFLTVKAEATVPAGVVASTSLPLYLKLKANPVATMLFVNKTF